MKKPLLILSILFIGIMLFACATTPIEQLYPERWEKTYIGMSLEEFKFIWPEAVYNGFGDLENTTEVWTIIKSGLASVKIEYFTFQEDKLVKYRGN